MRLPNLWQEPLKIGASLVIAAFGLLLLPDKHSAVIFTATGKSPYSEYIVYDEGTGIYVARNSSATEVDVQLNGIVKWMLHAPDVTPAPLSGTPGMVPPTAQAIAIVDSEPQDIRVVRLHNGKLVQPGKLIIATEHEDAVRFSLLLLLLSLLSMVVLVATSYVHRRSEKVE